MADAPERPPAPPGGFSLTKKYGPLPAWAWGLLGGGGIYAVYRYRQNKAASTAATTSATTDATSIDYAPEISTLQAEIQQLQQGESGEGGTTSPTTTPVTSKEPGPLKNQVKIPDVAGKRVAYAIDELHSEGLEPVTNPLRNPKDEYEATGTTPKAGLEVPKGTRVVIAVKHVGKTPAQKRTGSPKEISGGPNVPAPGAQRKTPARKKVTAKA